MASTSTGSRDELEPGEVALEVDGTRMEPMVIDARKLLRYAASQLELLRAAADLAGKRLEFLGVRVLNKCTAVATRPDGTASPRETAVRARAWQRAELPFPRRVAGAVASAREAARAWPPGTNLRLISTTWSEDLSIPAAASASQPWAAVTMRVSLERIGGEEPTAKLATDGEEGPFTVRVESREKAAELANFLYEEIEAELLLLRKVDGRIADGVLTNYRAVSGADPTRVWRDWFRRGPKSRWKRVANPEKELGRDD